MKELVEYVKRHHASLKGKRANWDSHWQEALDYIVPRKNNVYEKQGMGQTRGEKRMTKVFDSSPITYNKILAAALQSMLINPASQWLAFETGDAELDKNEDVTAYLQEMTRTVLSVLSGTNFYTETHENFLDLGAIGTGFLRIEEDDRDVFRFHSRPIYENYIVEDHKGLVNGFSTPYTLTSRQLKSKWDMEKLAKELGSIEAQKLEKLEKDPLQEWEILQYVFPRKEFPKGMLPNKVSRFKWASVHVVYELDIVAEVRGFKEFPAVVPRWTKTSSEEYGRGPGLEALPDIKMLNRIMQTQIRVAQKTADPSYQAPDDGISLPIMLTPGGINYYRAGTGDRIERIDIGGDLRITDEFMEQIRQRISKSFFVDQLQLLEGPQMTATEVLQRTEEKIRLLGPTLGRLHFEFLKPLTDRLIGIMGRKNLLPPNPPPELKDIEFKPRFSSMIARAQRASEADNISRVIQVVAPFVEAQPEVMDNFNGDELVRFVGNVFSVPQELFTDKEEMQETRGARAKAQKEAEELEKQKMQSESARNLGVTAQGV